MNYTKGEWKVEIARYTNKYPSAHIQANGWVICLLANTDNPVFEANANLIAAAPLMHQELEETRAMFARVEAVRKLKGYEQTRYTRIKQALAKAESK